MDPLQVIAARQISPARTSQAEDIDAFYDANAFEGLHHIRRALGQLVRLLRDTGSRLGRKAPPAPEFAPEAGRA